MPSDSQPTRRSLLASVGVSTTPFLAGCVDDARTGSNGSTADDAPQTPSQSPTTDTRTTPTTTQTDAPFADAHVSTAIRWVDSPDAIRVATPDRDAFLSVRLPVSLLGPALDRFELRVGDDSYTAMEFPGIGSETPGVALRRGDEPPRWLLFDVRATTVTDARLVAPDGRRARLSPRRLDRLDELPALRVESVQVPDEITPDTGCQVTVRVHNAGDGPGTWLGGIQNGGVYDTLTVTVPPGETRTATAWPTAFGQAGSSLRVSLSWGRASRLIEVPITSHDTPA